MFTVYSCKDNDSLNNQSGKENVRLLQNNNEEEYLKKDENGNIIIRGSLLNNKKHGFFKYYDKDTLTSVI